MRHLTGTLLLILAIGRSCHAQPAAVARQRWMLGGGLGPDVGGLGLRMDVRISQHCGLFLGMGTNFSRFGYGVGIHARILPYARFCPYATAMYGAFATGDRGEEQVSGPAVGGGLEWRSRTRPHGFRFGAMIPVHMHAAPAETGAGDRPAWPVMPTLGWYFPFGSADRTGN